jgi:glycosyltransferase involved in cell wall biosynthesis
MADKENSAPLLLDVTRQIWRRWEGVRPTGIDRICDAWLEHFGQRSQAVIITKRRQTILPVTASRALFLALSEPLPSNGSTSPFRRRMAAIALRWGSAWLRNLDGRGRFWLNAGHTGLHNPQLVDWCTKANVRPVYLVHDLIPITHPQFCRAGEEVKHTARILTVLRTGSAVVANSQHTLDVLTEFAHNADMKLPQAIVAWPGSESLRVEAGSPYSHQGPRDFVILGTIEGRKNHAFLLSVWERLIKTMGDACPRLIIVGRRGWEADEIFARLDRHDFKGKVIEAGALDDRELSQVLCRACALLFPSHAEGFGIPLVEALAAGIPVIASNLQVFREIAGDVPELLPVNDEEAWASALADYAAAKGTRRASQLERMKEYSAPNWTEHFARVDKLIDQIS